MHAVRRLVLSLLVLCLMITGAAHCLAWTGARATTLDFPDAVRIVQDKTEPLAHRRAAAAMLLVYCRMAIRALRDADDLRRQVDLLLPQIETLIHEPR